MTTADKIAMTQVLIGPEAEATESEVIVYLSIAEQKIIDKAFPFKHDEIITMPSKYDILQCEIACYLYNKKGAEGETVHNENGINRTYENADVPDSMLKAVIPYCGVV